jgi:hypothetical protein
LLQIREFQGQAKELAELQAKAQTWEAQLAAKSAEVDALNLQLAV